MLSLQDIKILKDQFEKKIEIETAQAEKLVDQAVTDVLKKGGTIAVVDVTAFTEVVRLKVIDRYKWSFPNWAMVLKPHSDKTETTMSLVIENL